MREILSRKFQTEMEQVAERVMDSASGGNSSDSDEKYCRDYLRNVCRRGKRCKFLHPGREEVPDITFCHDYQNKQCSRNSCRFIHCSHEEEEVYRNTGELPVAAMDSAHRQGLALPGVSYSEAPVCKDFLKGGCRRGSQCKFKHMNAVNKRGLSEPAFKRRRLEEAAEMIAVQAARAKIGFLEDELMSIKRRLDESHRQLHALAATNELLLEQNARLRLSKGPVVSLPAVTITNTPTGPPVTIAAAMAPGSVTQVSLATAGISIAPPVVTVAQTLATQPPQDPQQTPQPPLTLAQALPMSTMTMTAASAPLVSYPIVTQSLRPLMPSALAR